MNNQISNFQNNLWIEGGSLSGKTERMVQQFSSWCELDFAQQNNPQAASQQVLAIAVDSQQRRKLSDRLMVATQGKYPVTAVTPLSFFHSEVELFWTLLVKKLQIKAQFPLLLRIENEQELALQVWEDRLGRNLQMEGIGRDRLVRRLLDLLLLAAYAGQDIAVIPEILNQGIETLARDPDISEEAIALPSELWQEIGDALTEWRNYCWERGLLTYGIVTDLFVHHLLPDPRYQRQLIERFKYVIVDRTDEMPAIACDLSQFLLNNGAKGIFTFNPDGSARLGLGADPLYWLEIKSQCEVIELHHSQENLGENLATPILDIVNNPDRQYLETYSENYEQIYSIESVSRARLFRNVAQKITEAIATGEIKAGEIAIIAPGLDNIANYAIAEILRSKHIKVHPLNDQRPLSHSAQVRSLLTLLALVYPHLGQLVSRDHIAEMLVVLTEAIDPVRAGMLADYCFAPHLDHPKLLPSDTYNQWNRLGYTATKDYEQLRQWIDEQNPKFTPLIFIDRAIQRFLKPLRLSYELTTTLQALLETAQYHWQLELRLDRPNDQILEHFIQLIRKGTVTANPYTSDLPEDGVLLTTIFQYRMARLSHRWQFWLDTNSDLWLQGGAASLFGASLFLKEWNGEKWTASHQNEADRQRLNRLLRDLLDRTGDRLYLCHSELSTQGQIQNGILVPLIEISTAIS